MGLLVAACGDDKGDSSTGGTGGASGGSAIAISGSSTVEPISSRVAELWEEAGGSVDVTVDGPGTGDGFEVFCNGETDISDASRPIKAEEAETCAANDVEFVELKVGFDGIAVMTNPANDTVECLSFPDLYALVGPESEGVNSWDAAQPLATELGSTTQFPSAGLEITAPGSESGTYDSFIEIALEGIEEERAESGKISEDQVGTTRTDYTSQANDNAIIQAMTASDSPFGWVGFAFAEEAGDEVKELQVSEEPGGECVAPTAESIADGSYPLSRSLFIYVNKAKAEANPAIGEYVDFYLGEGYAAVEEVGYVALPDDQLSETKGFWSSRTTGTREA